MTTLELLYDEAKARRVECFRESSLLLAKADAYHDTMMSLDTAITEEKQAASQSKP